MNENIIREMYTYHVNFISLQHIVLYEWWWIVVAEVNRCQRRLWLQPHIEQDAGTAVNYHLTKWEQFPYFQQYHKFIHEVGHRTCVYGPRGVPLWSVLFLERVRICEFGVWALLDPSSRCYRPQGITQRFFKQQDAWVVMYDVM